MDCNFLKIKHLEIDLSFFKYHLVYLILGSTKKKEKKLINNL